MGAHLATAALATLAVGVPAYSHGAHLPLSRHVAAAGSLGAPVASAPPTRQDLRLGHRTGRVTIHRAGPATVRRARHRPAARAATDPAVTIADFRFGPSTVTVHVGETITWTNSGPSTHTATARDGSFDTGPLSRGHSASHTFTTPGTFAYVCTIHPFMHGTIVVLAADTSTQQTTATAPAAPSTTSATPTTGTTATTAGGSGTAGGSTSATTGTGRPGLPATGADLLSALAAGGVLLAAGLALRWAVRA